MENYLKSFSFFVFSESVDVAVFCILFSLPRILVIVSASFFAVTRLVCADLIFALASFITFKFASATVLSPQSQDSSGSNRRSGSRSFGCGC